MQKTIIKTISGKDSLFPKEFRHLEQPVQQFYAAGNLDLLKERPRLGIVGSRKITPYGQQVTTDLASAAAKAGATIVSGLALGVDSIAHKAALDVGSHTLAVLPSSLKKVYPASHHGLAQQILHKNGLLISEFEREEQPMKHYFIQRNRMIAALSDVLLVTEAAMDSGTRHTVDYMVASGKPICAVPGDINKASSAGTNHLIRDGNIPILSSSDLLAILGFNENLMKSKYQPENEHEAKILQALKQKPLSSNELIDTTHLSVSQLNTQLTLLEIQGVLKHSSNGQWRLSLN
jgi:DNA processing protein